MIQAIKQLFSDKILSTQQDSVSEHGLQIATAALLLEMMRMDHHFAAEERQKIESLLTSQFDITEEEVAQLIELAEKELNNSTDYFQFTSLINQHFSSADKINLVEMLWQVALADDNIDKYEEYFVRKLSDLIYVPHAEFIAAKHRAMQNR